nr:tRNA uridine-5-carboxymethylaminomethyl(34) synthesis GTPase MnmE [Prevotella sp.]
MNNDNICALATPTGGAIGIVRVSGPEAISITNSIFNKDISLVKPNTVHYGEIIDKDGSTID